MEDEIKCDQRHYWRRTFRSSFRDSITKGPTPCTRLLIDVYNKYNASAISPEEVPIDKVERYGIISGSEVEKDIYKINELFEKPPRDEAPSNIAIMGRYVLTPDIFDKINETEPSVGGEIQLTDALQKLDSIYGVAFKGRTYDLGNRLEWLKTSIEFVLMMSSGMIWSFT